MCRSWIDWGKITSAKLEKCEFDFKQLDFSGYHISTHGVQMDLQKMHTVLPWQNTKDVQSFLGFANIIESLFQALRKGVSP